MVLPESTLSWCYYPRITDNTTAAEMFDIVAKNCDVVLQGNLQRKNNFLNVKWPLKFDCTTYTNCKWVFFYNGILSSDNSVSQWPQAYSFPIIVCMIFKQVGDIRVSFTIIFSSKYFNSIIRYFFFDHLDMSSCDHIVSIIESLISIFDCFF